MADMPFFMRFVERQDAAEAPASTEAPAEQLRTGVAAGAESGGKERKTFEKGMETMKWPSDGDDGWPY